MHQLIDPKWIIPRLAVLMLLGTGKRFFSEAPTHKLTLVSSKAASSGVVINSYRYGGPLRTGNFGEA